MSQIRSRQLSCTDSTIFGYGSIRSANYAYDGPIKYYSETDAPQESGAESADGWEEADLWWNPEEDEEIFAEEKGKRKFREEYFSRKRRQAEMQEDWRQADSAANF